MDLGIYNAKYPFRRVINFLLPFFKEVNPNYISYAIIPLGIITAIIYWEASVNPVFYWIGIIFIFLRMLIGTLDGLVAENFQKQTPWGELLNRLAPESADILLILVIAFSTSLTIGLLAIAISWGISYAGLIGAVIGKKTQSVGPVGQTDRLVALILFSVLQFFSMRYGWNFNFMLLFLWWVILGGLLTIGIRCYRTFKHSMM